MPRWPHKPGMRVQVSLPQFLSRLRKNQYERTIKIKEISMKELNVLLENGILKNTNSGYTNQRGYHVGYYRTSGCAHKRYIEDWCVKRAREILK